jgi:hypothetical protein
MNNVKRKNSVKIAPQGKEKKTKKTEASTIILRFSAIVSFIIVILLIINTPNVYLSLGMMPLICGLAYEFKQLSQSWTKTFNALAWAQLGSLLCFLPGRSEHDYILGMHISSWPFAFCIFYIIMGIVMYNKQLVYKLGEGITMLQSLSFIYWMLDLKIFTNSNYFLITLGSLGLIASSFSLFHSYTYTILNKNNRLLLSLWSSVIMIIFAVDNIYHVYKYSQINLSDDTNIILMNMAQYFLLGVSAIHIVRNIFMITDFIPGRDTFFNKQYFEEVRELKKLHISRYSASQINIRQSIIISAFTIIFFGLNFYYHFVPRNFLIWSLFFLLPFALILLNPPTQSSDDLKPLEQPVQK